MQVLPGTCHGHGMSTLWYIMCIMASAPCCTFAAHVAAPAAAGSRHPAQRHGMYPSAEYLTAVTLRLRVTGHAGQTSTTQAGPPAQRPSVQCTVRTTLQPARPVRASRQRARHADTCLGGCMPQHQHLPIWPQSASLLHPSAADGVGRRAALGTSCWVALSACQPRGAHALSWLQVKPRLAKLDLLLEQVPGEPAGRRGGAVVSQAWSVREARCVCG
jgi:hypothetical protein